MVLDCFVLQEKEPSSHQKLYKDAVHQPRTSVVIFWPICGHVPGTLGCPAGCHTGGCVLSEGGRDGAGGMALPVGP